MTPDGQDVANKRARAPSHLVGTSWVWTGVSSSKDHPSVSTPGKEVCRDAILRRSQHSLLTRASQAGPSSGQTILSCPKLLRDPDFTLCWKEFKNCGDLLWKVSEGRTETRDLTGASEKAQRQNEPE